MANNTMSFLEAVREGIIKERDKVNPTACFIDGNQKVLLTEEETGYISKQLFVREDDLKFFYAKDSKGIPTIFANTTKFDLHMKGELGFANLMAALRKMVSVYSNFDIGLIARSIRKEDTRDSEYKDKAVSPDRATFLPSLCYGLCGNIIYLGVKCATGDNVNDCYLFSSDGDSSCYYAGISPAIHVLCPSILVDIDSMKKDGAWKLLPPETE